MKSLSNRLLAIAGGILKDASLAYPSDRKGFTRDLVSLTRLVEDRGLGVFTLDLPERESSLLSGLEFGRLISRGAKRYSKDVQVPRLFSGLYLRVFNREGMLLDDSDATALAFLRALLCLGKKLAVPCSRKRELLAIQEYVDVESSIRKPSLRWESDSLSLDGDRNFLHLRDCLDDDLPLFPIKRNIGRIQSDLLERCQRISDFISREFGHYSPDAVVDGRRELGIQIGLKHGPGAVAEKPGRYFDKYRFSNWSAKLNRLYPFEYFGRMPNDSDLKVINHEVPSRLICVPKTAKGPRIIAAEPSEHMFCQMLLKSWFEEKIKSTVFRNFINFKKQELSGKLVSDSSLTRELATIDLSSASDRLSCWLIERVFRKNDSIIDAIHASRTRWIHIPQRNEYLKLKKFASQGTAITFPVQTIVFTCIALASVCENDILKMSDRRLSKHLQGFRDKVRVYGDDIIIPIHGYVKITQLMHDLGLKVNTEKSFSRGFFRESCGTDSFKSYDVTPVKPKSVISDNPASCVAVLDTINNLFYKGYWNASEQLRHRLDSDSRQRFTIVGRDAGATGLGSFSFRPSVLDDYVELSKHGMRDNRALSWAREFSLRHKLGAVRLNKSTQRVEVRCGAIWTVSKVRPFDSGYSGLLNGVLHPLRLDWLSNGQSHVGGVPERPHIRTGMRWVGLTDLVS